MNGRRYAAGAAKFLRDVLGGGPLSERRRVLAHVRHFAVKRTEMQPCLSKEMGAKRGPWPASLSFRSYTELYGIRRES